MAPARPGDPPPNRRGPTRLAALPGDALLPAVPGVVALVDGDGTVLDVANGTVLDVATGSETDGTELVAGQRLHDVLPGHVADGLLGAVRRAIEEQRVVPYRTLDATDTASLPQYRETTITPVGADRVVLVSRDGESSHRDPLTGLPDRTTFHDRLERALVARGPEGTVAVLFVDVDNFKRVNDSLGYSRGDEVVAAVADRIVEVVGDTANLAHVAGDEFVVAIDPVDDVDDAVKWSTVLRLAIARPLPIGTGTLHLTASVGIAVAGEQASADTLLRDADTALHEAKSAGRNRHVVFEDSLRAARVDRVELEAALHTALQDDELCVHYQPVIDLTSGAMVGVEALVRWDRPGHGMVPPASFVPVAEQAGIINELGAWVLRHAVHDAVRWHEQTGLSVAVNVSASQLTDPGLAEAVIAALADAGLPGEALSLELTETAYTSASDTAVAALQRVRERGVRIALDDFGSGYSSLDRVRRFPVDVIKIDRESVVALPNGERDVTIVRAMIELAHALGVPVVAEGVEVRAEHDALVRLGCDQAQGYLYARPLPPEQLAERLGIVEPSEATARSV